MGICCSCQICNICQSCSHCGFSPSGEKLSRFNPKWIESLSISHPDKLIRDTIIPGTHDTGSYSISEYKCCSSIAITQKLSVYQQLLAGARYLDLRLAGTGESMENVYIFHGPIKGKKFFFILEEIVRFSCEFPKEFFIVEIVFEYGRKINDAQRSYIFELLSSKIGNRLFFEDIKNEKNLIDFTLEEITNRKRNIVLFYDDGLIPLEYVKRREFLEKKGFLNKKNYLMDKWHNTNKSDFLLKSNSLFLEENKEKKGKFLCNSMTLTPQVSGFKDILRLICGCNPVRVDNLTSSLIKKNKLEFFFRNNSKENWNFLCFDFFGYNTFLNKFLFGLNFENFKILVKKAIIKSNRGIFDVTKRANEIVEMCRGNSFFILDFEKDFFGGISKVKKGKFTMYCELIEGDLEKRGVYSVLFKRGKSKFLINALNFEEQGEVFVGGWESKGKEEDGTFYFKFD